MPPTRDRTHNLDMYPNRELNLNFLVYEAMLQPTEPHWPGLVFILK